MVLLVAGVIAIVPIKGSFCQAVCGSRPKLDNSLINPDEGLLHYWEVYGTY